MPADDMGSDVLLSELGRMNSELAAQRRLNALIAHDLGSPAQVMLGLSEMLLEHPDLDPMVRRRIEQLHRSAVTMGKLVADLGQGFSLDESSDLEIEPLDLVELVGSLVERTRVLASNKDITLQLLVEQPDLQGCWVDGDALKLERALSNLIGNAIKFSPVGTTVSIALDRGVDQATVAVQDQGPGVSGEARERIFEVHHREADTAHLPGQGLGLFITRQIARGHRGSVSCDSEPGRGCTFLLRLPLLPEESLAELA